MQEENYHKNRKHMEKLLKIVTHEAMENLLAEILHKYVLNDNIGMQWILHSNYCNLCIRYQHQRGVKLLSNCEKYLVCGVES